MGWLHRMDTISQREQSLQLFHLLGKLLYNKRDLSSYYKETKPLSISQPTGYGDSVKEDAADSSPPVQNELPDHLSRENRAPSKVDLVVEYKPLFLCHCSTHTFLALDSARRLACRFISALFISSSKLSPILRRN
jgi:hypothetical protein